MHTRFILFVPVLFAALAWTPAPRAIPPPQDVFIANARLVDVGARAVRDGHLLITGGTIAGFPASKPAGFSGQVVDAGRRWVMPALSDMHTRSVGNLLPPGTFEFLGPEATAKAALYAGVARDLDLFSDEKAIFAARASRQAATTAAADIFAAGPCLTATNGHCSEYGVPTRIVDTPADARREVSALAAARPDVVKVVYDHQTYGGRSRPSIDRATLEAVVATAKASGLKTLVHVGSWQDVHDAVLAGAAAVTHTPQGVPPTDLVRLMAERRTLHIPTLAVRGDYARFLDDPSLLESPLLAALIGPKAVTAFKTPPTGRFVGWVAWQRSLVASNAAAVKTLADAGVPMVTGTDAGNMAVFQGYSVHRELRLLVESGLSSWDALAATTINAGRLLDRTWGMRAGDEGTVVILDGSPVEGVTNTEAIHAVIMRGVVVDREALKPAVRPPAPD